MDAASLDNVTQAIIDELVGDTRVVLTSAALLASAVVSMVHMSSYWARKCKGKKDEKEKDQLEYPIAV